MFTSRKRIQQRSFNHAGLGETRDCSLGTILLAAAMVLVACQASPQTGQVPSPLPPEPTSTPLPPSTATEVPTKVPTTTPTLRPKLGPEVPAVSIEQVAGQWLLRAMGGGEGDPAVLTLAEDGTHSLDGIGGYHEGMNLGTGTYWFDGDIMSLYSENCTSTSVMFFTCTATYHVFVAMGEDGPGALRFVAIEDPHPDRKKSLNNKMLYPAAPTD